MVFLLDFHGRTFFQPHLLSTLLGKGIFDTNLSIEIIRNFKGDMCLLKLLGLNRLYDLFDCAGQSKLVFSLEASSVMNFPVWKGEELPATSIDFKRA